MCVIYLYNFNVIYLYIHNKSGNINIILLFERSTVAYFFFKDFFTIASLYLTILTFCRNCEFISRKF